MAFVVTGIVLGLTTCAWNFELRSIHHRQLVRFTGSSPEKLFSDLINKLAAFEVL